MSRAKSGLLDKISGSVLSFNVQTVKMKIIIFSIVNICSSFYT